MIFKQMPQYLWLFLCAVLVACFCFLLIRVFDKKLSKHSISLICVMGGVPILLSFLSLSFQQNWINLISSNPKIVVGEFANDSDYKFQRQLFDRLRYKYKSKRSEVSSLRDVFGSNVEISHQFYQGLEVLAKDFASTNRDLDTPVYVFIVGDVEWNTVFLSKLIDFYQLPNFGSKLLSIPLKIKIHTSDINTLVSFLYKTAIKLEYLQGKTDLDLEEVYFTPNENSLWGGPQAIGFDYYLQAINYIKQYHNKKNEKLLALALESFYRASSKVYNQSSIELEAAILNNIAVLTRFFGNCNYDKLGFCKKLGLDLYVKKLIENARELSLSKDFLDDAYKEIIKENYSQIFINDSTQGS